jgi:hypothetical protein
MKSSELIGGEVSQIIRKQDEDSIGPCQEGIINKNENTTFLLKRMYSLEERNIM